MKKTTGPYPASTVDGAGSSVVPHAGSTVLLRTAQAVGLTTALAEALTPWRKPLARHDPGKIVADLAVSLAIGGDCLADLAQLREVGQAIPADRQTHRQIGHDLPRIVAGQRPPPRRQRLAQRAGQPDGLRGAQQQCRTGMRHDTGPVAVH